MCLAEICSFWFNNLTDAGEVLFAGSGLYRIDVVTDMNGDYGNRFVELVVKTSEEGNEVETIVKKHI